MTIESIAAPSEAQTTERSSPVTVLRYFVATNMRLDSGEEWLFALTPHYATEQRAEAELMQTLPQYPGAAVLWFIVACDLRTPEGAATYERYAKDFEQENALLGPAAGSA
jgi:hypothetical protein